ncbi:MAG: hypothetical protein KGL39_36065 [Patescibacteria group bacterium]|nr:hypothetical protein [Patescibacteria group bacterium]
MTVCGRSWGKLHHWTFCTLPKGHDGPCACKDKPKPPDEKYYEEQPEAADFVSKQIADERLKIARKESTP